MGMSARRIVARVVLIAGLSLCVAWAALRTQALGRPWLDPQTVPRGGGIGSVSVDPVSGVLPLVFVAMATFLLLARAPTLRTRPAAVAYVAITVCGAA